MLLQNTCKIILPSLMTLMMLGCEPIEENKTSHPPVTSNNSGTSEDQAKDAGNDKKAGAEKSPTVTTPSDPKKDTAARPAGPADDTALQALIMSKKWTSCNKATLDDAGYLSTTFSFAANNRSTFQKHFKDAACTVAFSTQELIDLGRDDQPVFVTGVTSSATYTIRSTAPGQFNLDLTFEESSSFLAGKVIDGNLHMGSCTFEEALNGCGSSDAMRARNFAPDVSLVFKPVP